MPKKNFTSSIQKTFEEGGPEEFFDRGEREPSTSRQIITGTKGLKGARLISIGKINPDPDQPRKNFPKGPLQELAESIRSHGILNPITVEYMEADGLYKIIAGERRYQAAKLAEFPELPCIILERVENDRRKALQLVENLQREDLSPIDKARAILEFKGLVRTWEEVDRFTGLSPRRRQQYTALLKLPDDMQEEIVSLGRRPSSSQITEKHARALLLLKGDEEKQRDMFERMKGGDHPLTGDQALERAKELKGKPKQMSLTIRYGSREELIRKLEEQLRKLNEEA